MPRKRKVTHRRKSRSRRRSSMGAISFDITGMALAVGGALAAKVITTKLSASTNTTLAKFAPYLPLAVGVALPMLIKKNPMVAKLSIGLIAGGGITALGSGGLKIISGLENSVNGIGYPMPYRMGSKSLVAGIGAPAGNAGLQKGTRSNFSGSRMSQIRTIAGVMASNGDGSAN